MFSFERLHAINSMKPNIHNYDIKAEGIMS